MNNSEIQQRFLVYENMGIVKGISRKKVADVTLLIKQLYRDHPPTAMRFEEYLSDNSIRVKWGYAITADTIILNFGKEIIMVQDKWRDISTILSFFELDWNDYFERIDFSRFDAVKKICSASQKYHTQYGKTILDIGEIGECYAGYLFDFWMSKSKITEGYDALDSNFNRVQIKTVRNDKDTLARSSQFSAYECDYVLMLWFKEDYQLEGISMFRKCDLPIKSPKDTDDPLKRAKKPQILFSDTRKIPKAKNLKRNQISFTSRGEMEGDWNLFVAQFTPPSPVLALPTA